MATTSNEPLEGNNTPEGESVDGAPSMVKQMVSDQGNDSLKGSKRKRTSSPSDGAGLGGTSDLVHGASKGGEHEGSEATGETGKGPKTKGRKNRKLHDKVRPAPGKKTALASKKGMGDGAKGKAGAGEKGGSEVSEEGNDVTGLLTTPPPDDGNANSNNEAGDSGDEKPRPKGRKAVTKGVGRKEWSQAEDEVIIALYATKTPVKEIAAALNKLPSSSTTLVVDVQMTAHRWHNVLKHIITWSDEEVKVLKTTYDAIVKDQFTALADRMNKELDVTKFTKQGCEKKIKELMKEIKSK